MLSWALWASACPGGGQILGCIPKPCTPGPGLLDSCSRQQSRLTAEPPPKPLRVAPGAPQPPPHGASSSAGGAATKLLLGLCKPLRTEPPPKPLRAGPGSMHVPCSP